MQTNIKYRYINTKQSSEGMATKENSHIDFLIEIVHFIPRELEQFEFFIHKTINTKKLADHYLFSCMRTNPT